MGSYLILIVFLSISIVLVKYLKKICKRFFKAKLIKRIDHIAKMLIIPTIILIIIFLIYKNIDTPKSNYLLFFNTPISVISNLDGMGQALTTGKFFITFNCTDSVILKDIKEYKLIKDTDDMKEIVEKYIISDLQEINENYDISMKNLKNYDLWVKKREKTKFQYSWFLENREEGWYFFKIVY